jgi:N,N'-diacetyllegionaminate synthase
MSLWNGKYGPLLIAEIGGNHEGNFDYAKKLCQLAIDSKADYVKFQLYTGDGLVSPVESPDRNAHFKKFELTKEQHIELAEMVINAGRRYTASVWNTEFIDWIFIKSVPATLLLIRCWKKSLKGKSPSLFPLGWQLSRKFWM